MNFLPIAILAYALNGGAILIDKILIRTALPKPLTYTFYVSTLQLLALFLVPFGFKLEITPALYFATASGLIWVLALYAMFSSLRDNQASVVGIIVGIFNPVFALILGVLLLNQTLAPVQYLAFLILIAGTVIFTLNLWFGQIKFNRKFALMALSGFLFGLSYVLIRQAFLESSFLNGLIISRASAGFFALTFLFLPSLRKDIFASNNTGKSIPPKTTLILLGTGQIMGAASAILITFGISLANPALVNSLFGIQYPVILIAALILLKKHPNLLNEQLTKSVIAQKIAGAMVLSVGLYLLAT